MAEAVKTNQEQLYAQFKNNPMLFGLLYLPHHFRLLPPPSFHVKIVTESMKHQFMAVQAPRESAKSTVLTFLHSLHGIVFKRFRFIVIVQNTFNKAAGSLDGIKKEMKDNQFLMAAFPIDITRDAQGDSIFRHPDGFETRVLCKGADQIGSVRGEKFGAYRPDLIIVDDLEDDEMVKNPDRRRELKELYDEALIPAGEKGKVKVLAIGTILHDDCLMAKLVSSEEYLEYRKLFYTARYVGKGDGENRSLWPNKWTLEYLNQLEKDKPSVFAKEYMGDPVSGRLTKFESKDFRYWRIENNQYVLFDENNVVVSRGNLNTCKAAIACDLAWEEDKQSDYSVIMPGFLTPTSDILIEQYICKKGLRPSDIYEILFSMEERLRTLTGDSVPIGFEKAKLEKVIKHLLKDEMRLRNKFLWTKDLAWDADKIQRIVTRLQPRYAQHTIYHKKGMGDYETQLLRIPSGVHDDLADAAQGLCQLLQYPKGTKKSQAQSEDSGFDALRKLVARQKEKKGKFVYGQKNKTFEIPSIISLR